MCLPNLYSQVVLRSYDRIRYSTETARPEGCGGASPFTAGLEALVTRGVSRYVKDFEVVGNYKELGSEDYARVGRVPDGGMMLNLLVRTAIDRMTELRTFRCGLPLQPDAIHAGGPQKTRSDTNVSGPIAGTSTSRCSPSCGK